MPHGLLLVGGSLSGQHFSSFRALVGVGADSLLLEARPDHATPWERAPGSTSMYLYVTLGFLAFVT